LTCLKATGKLILTIIALAIICVAAFLVLVTTHFLFGEITVIIIACLAVLILTMFMVRHEQRTT